jgi:cytochrome P450
MRVFLYLYPVLLAAAALLTVSFVSIRVRRAIVRRRFALSHGCQPIAKSCNKFPLLGIDVMLENIRATREHRFLELSRQRHALLGNTFESRQLLKPAILTVEPENIMAILALNFKDYGIGHRLQRVGPLLGAGIFTHDGEHWETSRALIRPSFSRKQVADLTQFEELLSELLSLIPRDGKTTVDLQDLLFRYSIDSATTFLFGQSVGSLKKSAQSESDLAHAFDYAQESIRMRKFLGPLSRFYSDPKADGCNKLCREFAQQFVDEAVRAVEPDQDCIEKDGLASSPRSKGQKYIFSHELARRTSDKRRILDELMNVFMAGYETTASLLSNLFFMLARHPRIWSKLRKEIAVLDGRVPSYEEVRNFKFLKCCINECEISMRQHKASSSKMNNG